MGTGPRLPMEFSRISPKRLMSLVVVLDPASGADCPTHWIASRRSSVAEASLDLAGRERCAEDFIGAVCLESGLERGRGPIVSAVRDWCARAGLGGAVWTELVPNFEAETGAAFAIEPALAYLRGLTGVSLAEAVRYIESAPVTTDTPLRRALAADPWWREAAGR